MSERVMQEMSMLLRGLSCVLLMLVEPSCFAQEVTIRVIKASNGGPLRKQPVDVSLLYGKGETPPPKFDSALKLETDANGTAHFALPEPAPSSVFVMVRLSERDWKCGYSVTARTQ